MESALASLLPTLGGPAIAIIIVVYLYLKITSQRKETKAERDKDSQDIHDKIMKHEFEISNLKGEQTHNKQIQEDLQKQITILSESVCKLSVSVEHFSKAVEELRQDMKDARR